MIDCTCGKLLLADVGVGFVVMPEGHHRWMRRRSDTLICAFCGVRYTISDLKDLPASPKAASSA